MLKNCCYVNCNERERQFDDVKYFLIPEDYRRNVWLKHGRVVNIKWDLAFMCSKHFYSKDIFVRGSTTKLTKFAVPMSCASVCSCTEKVTDDSCLHMMIEARSQIISAIRTPEPALKPIPLSAFTNSPATTSAFGTAPSTAPTPSLRSTPASVPTIAIASQPVTVSTPLSASATKPAVCYGHPADVSAYKKVYKADKKQDFSPSPTERFRSLNQLKTKRQLHLNTGLEDSSIRIMSTAKFQVTSAIQRSKYTPKLRTTLAPALKAASLFALTPSSSNIPALRPTPASVPLPGISSQTVPVPTPTTAPTPSLRSTLASSETTPATGSQPVPISTPSSAPIFAPTPASVATSAIAPQTVKESTCSSALAPTPISEPTPLLRSTLASVPTTAIASQPATTPLSATATKPVVWYGHPTKVSSSKNEYKMVRFRSLKQLKTKQQLHLKKGLEDSSIQKMSAAMLPVTSAIQRSKYTPKLKTTLTPALKPPSFALTPSSSNTSSPATSSQPVPVSSPLSALVPNSNSCCYVNCGEKQRALGDMSFFTIPLDHRKIIWFKHGRVVAKKNSQHKYLMCAKHFYDKDIIVSGTRKNVTKFALPKSSPSVCCCSDSVNDALCVSIMNAGRLVISSKIRKTKYTPIRTATPSLETTNVSKFSTSHSTISAFANTPTSAPTHLHRSSPAYVSATASQPLPASTPSSASDTLPAANPSTKFRSYKKVYKIDPNQVVLPSVPVRLCSLKQLKAQRQLHIKEGLEVQMQNFTQDLKTFILAQIFPKHDGPWSPEEKDLFIKFHITSKLGYEFMLNAGFKLPSVSTINCWRSELVHAKESSKLKTEMLTDEDIIQLLGEKDIKEELEIKDEI